MLLNYRMLRRYREMIEDSYIVCCKTIVFYFLNITLSSFEHNANENYESLII